MATAAEAEPFVAFVSGDQLLLSPLDSIDEIVEPMKLNPVPGSRHWFLGLGTLQGSLLAVSDFTAYIGSNESSSGSGNRLLVISRDTERVGLMVDEVMGLVQPDAFTSEAPIDSIATGLAPLAIGTLRFDGQAATLVDLTRLFDLSEFVSIGLTAEAGT